MKYLAIGIIAWCLMAAESYAASHPITYCATVNTADETVLAFAASKETEADTTVAMYVQRVIDRLIRDLRPVSKAADASNLLTKRNRLSATDRAAVDAILNK